MNDPAPVIYGLEFQARTLCPQLGETDAIRFLVGTQSLRSTNQVHLLDFEDESNLITKHVFSHEPGEVWHIASNPLDKNILATSYNKIIDGKTKRFATMWRIPPLDETAPPVYELTPGEQSGKCVSLQHVCDLNSDHGDVKKVIWNPSSDSDRLLTISERHIDLWQTSNSGAKLVDSISLEGKAQLQYSVGRFNPHHGGSQVLTGIDSHIKGYDLRSMTSSFSIENAHSQLIRDVDMNPNKQYYLASCSDDCKVKFWDIRNTKDCLMTRSDHSHWVWGIRYNNFHDQLILTSSSDSQVILSSIASLSSEPFGHVDDDDEDEEEEAKPREPLSDRVISVFEEHEDSVYSVEWSSVDPWIFASLSYDGRLVINRVPRVEKYKILL